MSTLESLSVRISDLSVKMYSIVPEEFKTCELKIFTVELLRLISQDCAVVEIFSVSYNEIGTKLQ